MAMIPDVQVNLHPASQIPSLFRKSCLEFRKSIKKSSPEVAQNVNTKEMGNLGLTKQEEAAVVSFLKTLSDRR